jgi:hypothetical protein
MHVDAAGFQHLVDSYFWYLPFECVRQCKYVMGHAGIPEDEWLDNLKRVSLAEEHKTEGARKSLTAGLEDWLKSELFIQRQVKFMVLPTSTKRMFLDY